MTSAQRFTIDEGDAGVRQTVARMADLIRAGVATPAARRVATQIVANVVPTDYLAQIYAIRAYLTEHIQFLRDPSGVELLHTPDLLLSMIAENGAAYVDCDDAAILGGTLAGAIGMRVALVTVAFLDTKQPNRYADMSHIWASVSPPSGMYDDAGNQLWIELDATRPFQALPLHAIARSDVFPVIV